MTHNIADIFKNHDNSHETVATLYLEGFDKVLDSVGDLLGTVPMDNNPSIGYNDTAEVDAE